jgi:outer membrane protein OmpA-like peptidoglycan-associated protein/predicted  nucleic acid-binding Zn-ribbon protein
MGRERLERSPNGRLPIAWRRSLASGSLAIAALASAGADAAAMRGGGDPPAGNQLLRRAAEAQPAAPAGGRSVEELKAALEEVRRRLAERRGAAPAERPATSGLAEELKAARQQVERLTRSMAELRGERDGLRGQLVATREELRGSQARLVEAEARAAEAEGQGSRRAQALERELAEARAARAEAEGGLERAVGAARAAETDLAGELDRTQAKLRDAETRSAALARETEELRAIAAASVDEVETLGEQLLAALGEHEALAAALGDFRASRDLLEGELQEGPAPAAGGGAATAAAGGAEASPARLEAPPEEDPPSNDRPMTRLDGSAFAPGSAELQPEAQPSLAAVAGFVRSHPVGRVWIVGYTDSSGDDEENRVLSVRRAEAVREHLVREFGLEPGRLEAYGLGESDPVAPNDTAEGRQANRRVDIHVRP